jgi:hypothetical protein
MDEREEFEKIVNETRKRLEENPELQKEVDMHAEKIQKIFGHTIEINLVYGVGYDEYRSTFNRQKENNYPLEDCMSLGELINIMEDEDRSLKLSIDPIHLNDGVNDITNMLLIPLDNKVIIVPKTIE